MSEPIKVASLFSGAGGLDIGFSEHPAFEVVLHLDVYDTAIETLNANKGTYVDASSVILNEDVTEFAADLEQGNYEKYGLDSSLADEIDFVIGGPPCQPFSAAARRAGGTVGTDSEEGQLFMAYVDLLDIWQPKGFLFENVYGVTSNEEDWEPIVEAFQGAGYEVEKPRTARTLDAADYGVPQHRERTFIVGVHEDKETATAAFRFPKPTHGPDSEDGPDLISAGEALEKVDSNGANEDDTYRITSKHAPLLDDIPPGLNYAFYTEKLGHPDPVFGWRSRFSDYLYKADPESPVRTLKAQPGAASGPFHWENRKFTEAELKRLQSFPDDYVLEGGYGHVVKQIGNSVPPRIACVLATAIGNQLFGYELDEEEATQLFDTEVFDGTPRIEPMPDSYELNFRSRKRTSSEEYKQMARMQLEKLGLWEPANAREAGQKGLENFTGDGDSDGGEKDHRTVHWGFSADSHFDSESAETAEGVSEYPQTYTVESKINGQTLAIEVEGSDEAEGRIELALWRNHGSLLASLGVNRIELAADGVNLEEVFPLWYILKQDVLARTRYEKLVDIVGHYSTTKDDYSSTITVTDVAESEELVRTLEFVSDAENSNTEWTLPRLTKRVGCPPVEIVDAFQQLRRWRYEIRTPTTDRTMGTDENGHENILFTYPFPDLTSTSHFDETVDLDRLYEEAREMESAENSKQAMETDGGQ
ncbi:DNA cytosine methyltransferase [Haloferax sp. DFSO60]|uniref:DNA cytosine methyltransferase n=1 Tax=Haloferax sp. DFSO60 TaxID=3388652 RepID=UPI003979A92F